MLPDERLLNRIFLDAVGIIESTDNSPPCLSLKAPAHVKCCVNNNPIERRKKRRKREQEIPKKFGKQKLPSPPTQRCLSYLNNLTTPLQKKWNLEFHF